MFYSVLLFPLLIFAQLSTIEKIEGEYFDQMFYPTLMYLHMNEPPARKQMVEAVKEELNQELGTKMLYLCYKAEKQGRLNGDNEIIFQDLASFKAQNPNHPFISADKGAEAGIYFRDFAPMIERQFLWIKIYASTPRLESDIYIFEDLMIGREEKRVVKHELLHRFAFSHVDTHPNIMHPYHRESNYEIDTLQLQEWQDIQEQIVDSAVFKFFQKMYQDLEDHNCQDGV